MVWRKLGELRRCDVGGTSDNGRGRPLSAAGIFDSGGDLGVVVAIFATRNGWTCKARPGQLVRVLFLGVTTGPK